MILKEWHLSNKSDFFTGYMKQYTDSPMLVMLVEQGDYDNDFFPTCCPQHLADNLGEANNAGMENPAIDAKTNSIVAPNGVAGFRWGEQGDKVGRWNLELKDGGKGGEIDLRCR